MTNLPRVDFDELDLGDEQLSTWQGRPFTGVAFENSSEGKLRCEQEFVDGLRQGVTRQWHPNSQRAYVSHCWKDVLHGKHTGFNPDGKLVQEEIHELGILVHATYFADDGTVTRTYDIDPNDSLLQSFRKAYG